MELFRCIHCGTFKATAPGRTGAVEATALSPPKVSQEETRDVRHTSHQKSHGAIRPRFPTSRSQLLRESYRIRSEQAEQQESP